MAIFCSIHIINFEIKSDILNTLISINESITSISEPLKETLNPETRRKALGALKDIQEKIQISKPNNPVILNDLKYQQSVLKKTIEDHSKIEIALLDLISNFDDFICNQQINLSHFDLKYKLSSIDRNHPLRQNTTISKSHKHLFEYFNTLSPEQKVIFINDTCSLSGLKKLYLDGDQIKSGTCPNIDEILNAIMVKEGFWLVKIVLNNNKIPDTQITPLYLLKELMNYYNRKGRTISKG